MIRILILVLAVGTLVYVGYKLLSMVNINRCRSCNVLGYWEGTRGDRNQCKDCGGSGKG